MTIPINLFYWTLCIVPILLLLLLMIKFQWGALKAAPFTLVITIAVSFLFFKANGTLITLELLKAAWNSVSIILVILTAIFLYEVSSEAKAFDTLNRLFKKVAPNELIRILLIGVVFASFLQGITGFGVPVLVAAPLLLNIGVAPMWAVVIPLLGHSWAGTFGTLALAWNALILQTGLENVDMIRRVALYASLFLLLLTFIYTTLIAFFYGKGKAIKKGLVPILAISIIQGGGQMLFSLFKPELASFVPSFIALLVLILLSKSKWYNKEWQITDSKVMLREDQDTLAHKEQNTLPESNQMSVNQALLPYYLVTIITLAVLLIPFLNKALNQFSYGPSFIETSTRFGVVNTAIDQYAPIAPFTHASMFLLISALVSYLYYRKKGLIKNQALGPILTRTVKKALSPSIAVLSLLAISRVMAGTGQTLVLAEGISRVLNEYYVVLSPFIGLLGSFITGSNMSSNILFGDFQLLTSQLIGLNSAAILGAQTGGGGIGTAIAPGNIILGTSTAGILGSEGKVLSKILPITLMVAAFFGLLLLIEQFVF